jgi:hypothetical protein
MRPYQYGLLAAGASAAIIVAARLAGGAHATATQEWDRQCASVFTDVREQHPELYDQIRNYQIKTPECG